MVTMGVDGVTKGLSEEFMARLNGVSDGYFDMLGMRVIAGRGFDGTDNEKSPRVVIVNQCLAKKYLGSQNPIGQRITVQGNGTNLFTIVGLINDVHQTSFIHDPEPELYFQYLQVNSSTVYVLAKVEHVTDINRFATGLKKELQALDNRQAAGNIEQYTLILGRSLQMQKFRTYLLACFAGITLMLSAVGIFGFLSYTVGQRTREIGILAALGAPRNYVINSIMRETLLVIGSGLVVGLSAALAIARLIESFLFQVASKDIFTFLSVALFVGVVATLAAYFPTRKAAGLEVTEALRS